MTWKEFKDKVKNLLTVDKDRLGGEEFVEAQIRAAVLDLEDMIPMYREGQQNIYTAANVSAEGACSAITLPDQCQVRDAYVLRTKTPDDPIDGTTTANASKTITGSGTSFTTSVALGDYIALSSAPNTWAMVVEIHSDTELKVDANLGDGTSQTIKRQWRYLYPVNAWPWEDRQELFTGSVNLEQKALGCIDPSGQTFYLFPSLQSADSDGYAYSFELNWDGVKLEFEDADNVPFDEQMAIAAADWVKGECARHFDHDQAMWATFLQPFTGPGRPAGSYYRKRQMLYLKSRNRIQVRQ